MPRLLALTLLVVSGCGKPDDKPSTPHDTDVVVEPDDSGGNDSGDTSGGNDSGVDTDDTGADTSDSGDTGPDTGTSEVLVPGSAWCAAGGSVSGGGYTGTFCLAPVDLAAGTVATGGGYTWQPGPVVLLPRSGS